LTWLDFIVTLGVLGSLFTYAKYNIFRSPGLSFQELFDKLIIIFAITGIIVVFFVVFSILGKRKLDKELEDQVERVLAIGINRKFLLLEFQSSKYIPTPFNK